MMGRLKTFKGGVHPKEYKAATKERKIEEVPLPDVFYISTSQHFGKPARPIVKVGDYVEEGQLIAEADAYISAPVHAPVSGTIKQIKKFLHISGIPAETIILERDQNAQLKTWEKQVIDIEALGRSELVHQIKEKGVVGLGGAGFPSFVKFLGKEGCKLEKVLINACECEPFLNVDFRAMMEDSEQFVEGLQLIKTITGVDEIIIGIESNKQEAIKLLVSRLFNEEGMRVEELETKYPQGGEKMLVKAVLNKDVPRGGLPLDVGVVVLNVNTVLAIHNAVFYNKPLIEKTLTVAGKGIGSPKNLSVRIGTLIEHVIEQCGGLKDNTKRLVVGGPMMGIALFSTEVPIIKTTTGLLALSEEEIGNTQIAPCIRCGHCVTECPMRLMPTDIAKYVEHERIDLAKKAGLLDCIECGTCVYGCQSKRPIVQMVKLGKIKNREIEMKEKKG
jgi:electron transport complex protein RnfC